MIRFITRTPVLWCLSILFVAITISFGIIMRVYDFALIDEIWQPDTVSAAIAAMTDAQRRVHIITTATLDVAYPIVFGSLFAGLSLRFFPRALWLAFPGFAVIPVDLAEGVVQIMALSGNMSGLGVKAVLTPLKLGLFGLGGVIALSAILAGVIRYLRRPRA